MYTLPLLALALCTTFLYRAKHPERQLNAAAAHAARRYRLGLGLLTMVLFVSAAYRAPIELGTMITSAQERQATLQAERLERGLAAERKHVDLLIQALDGVNNYMLFLKAQNCIKR